MDDLYPDQQSNQVERLARFLKWAIVAAGMFSLPFMFLGFSSQKLELFLYGVNTLAQGSVFYLARLLLLKKQAVAIPTMLVCFALSCGGLVCTLLAPAFLPVTALFPVLTVMIALPYGSRPFIRTLLVSQVGVELLIVALGLFVHLFPAFPNSLSTILTGTPVMVSFIFMLVWHYVVRLQESLAVAQQEVLERLRTEGVLREAEQRFRHVFEDAPIGMLLIGHADKIVQANAAFCDVLGYQYAEVVGINPGQLVHPADRDVGLDELAQLNAGHVQRCSFSRRYTKKDGGTLWGNVTASIIGDEAGAPLYRLEMLEDMAERKAAEDARLAQLLAEQENKAKSFFLSRMSHELRTPLNAILGFSQLLAMEELNPEQQESVSFIRKGGEHLLGLINELLEIARMEAGQVEVFCHPISATAVIEESLNFIRPLAAQWNVTLDATAALAEEVFVHADSRRLKQVLLNLLGNAIKYTHHGGQVFVACAYIENDRVKISIRDTGQGIAPDRLNRLFKPFERLGAEYTAIEGTGLGLSVSKGLITAMDGTIGVESTLGAGSTFWVALPRVEQTQTQEVSGALVARAIHEPLKLRSNRRVLCIEDNPSNSKLIEHALSRHSGITLHFAARGFDGVNFARTEVPDLILLDLNLPDMPGDIVLYWLREMPETRKIPVIVMSADATPEAERHMQELGIYAYITKPFDLQEFWSILHEVLG